MTAPFLLDVRAAQTGATRDYFTRSRPWADEGRAAALSWFAADATNALTAAYWEIDSFVRSLGPSGGTPAALTAQAVAAINRSAAAVRAMAEAALGYAATVRDVLRSGCSPDAALSLAVRPLDQWAEKCGQAYRLAFEHWLPLEIPSPEQVAEWSAAGELISVEDCIAELADRLPPGERDELRRRVAAGG